MPFDRNDNILSALPLVTPYHHHPRAPATGRVASMVLEQAYLYARAYARPIGVQTYRATQLTSLANNFAVNQTTLTPVGRWRVRLPAEATTLVCYASYSLVSDKEGVVSHQLTYEEGADSDSGDTIVTNARTETAGAVNASGYTSYDYANALNGVASVVRTTTSGANTGVLTMSAFAVNAEGVAIGYRPHNLVAFYEMLEV